MLSAYTLAALQADDWPGNVRQLRNLMDCRPIMAPSHAGDPIGADMPPPEIGSRAPALLNIDPTADIMSLPSREARDLFATQCLHAQLLRFGGNTSRIAQLPEMGRSALHQKLKQLGVNSEERVGGYKALCLEQLFNPSLPCNRQGAWTLRAYWFVPGACMSIHPVYLLAFATFLLVIGFLAWNLLSVKRRQKTRGNTSGIGGPNDPLA